MLNPARSLARHPLFQVMLALQNNAPASLELPGLTAALEPVDTPAPSSTCRSASPSSADRTARRRGSTGVLEYATDLFDRASVEALAGRLVRLLEAAVADPERAIGSLDILAAEERHTILQEWNDTARPVPSATLPELFEAQVARTPDAVAVVFEDTKPHLWRARRARQSAGASSARARRRPRGRRRPCVERSLEMSSGCSASSRPAAPICRSIPTIRSERLAFMLGMPARRCCSPSRPARAPSAHSSAIICSIATGRPSRSNPQTAPANHLDPHNLAYVIYTSGSTGHTKGRGRHVIAA